MTRETFTTRREGIRVSQGVNNGIFICKNGESTHVTEGQLEKLIEEAP